MPKLKPALYVILLFIYSISNASASATYSTQWKHALTLFGEAKYPANFTHFDYVNPDAPKGGMMKLAHSATFDSLNNFIMKGVTAPGLGMLYDSLMTRSLDEPQTYYPLIATGYNMPADRSWIEFRINPKARWHDGKPITVDDIIWSLHIMKTEADPVYRLTFTPLAKAIKIDEQVVRFIFAENASREAPILAATLPILPKHYYAEVEFNKTTLTPPLGSGPYHIADLDAGRFIMYERVKDYWAADLPVNRGRHNFDKLRYDIYRDATVALEAFKAGEYDFRREYISRNWATAYNIPAIAKGDIIKTEIPNKLPQGMQAFFFNIRKPDLADRAVREAIALTMDFEWINKALFYGAYKRNRSFFQYTDFEATGVPTGKELEFLQQYADILPTKLFTEPFTMPKTDGSGHSRTNLLRAQNILEQAGYKLIDGKRINPHTGRALQIEFLLRQPSMQRVAIPMRKGLEKLGIITRIRHVDDAQYQQRVNTRDFDLISSWINLGIAYPGVEQRNYWHSSQADIEGSVNVTGLKHPAVDAAIDAITSAHTLEELTPAAKALDRILLWEHVVIPHWHSNSFRVAWWNKFGKPNIDPPYGLPLDAWWYKQ